MQYVLQCEGEIHGSPTHQQHACVRAFLVDIHTVKYTAAQERGVECTPTSIRHSVIDCTPSHVLAHHWHHIGQTLAQHKQFHTAHCIRDLSSPSHVRHCVLCVSVCDECAYAWCVVYTKNHTKYNQHNNKRFTYLLSYVAPCGQPRVGER